MNLHAYSLFWDFPSIKKTRSSLIILSFAVHTNRTCICVSAYLWRCVCMCVLLYFSFYFSKTCNLNFVDKMSFAAWAWASNKWEMSGSFLEFHLERRSCFNMINERIQKTCLYWMAHSLSLSLSLSKQLSFVEILCIIISKANLNTLRSSWLWRPLALSQLNFTFFTYLYLPYTPIYLFLYTMYHFLLSFIPIPVPVFRSDSMLFVWVSASARTRVCVCLFHFKVCD